jgi:hypothetical protein
VACETFIRVAVILENTKVSPKDFKRNAVPRHSQAMGIFMNVVEIDLIIYLIRVQIRWEAGPWKRNPGTSHGVILS